MRSGRLFSQAKSALILSAGAACVLACVPSRVRASTLTENFTTLEHFDATATAATGSAGLWNINTGAGSNPGPCAMVAVIETGTATNEIPFGNGSDGAINSSTGYTFDTDSHPNGYNFTSVNITGGTITITGSNPLIIRSLTNVTITQAITLDGQAGNSAFGGGSGGSAGVNSLAVGGSGGSSAGGNGVVGSLSDGSAGPGAVATGCSSGTGAGACSAGNASNTPGVYGPTDGVSGDFDSNGFVAGGAGGGGGGNSNGQRGGGGGGGGGALRITALGTISLKSVSSNGGNGGSNGDSAGTVAGGCVNASTPCSGSGAGGNGGSIWIQSFNGNTVSNAGATNANGGTAGPGNGNAGEFGNIRSDDPHPGTYAWATGGAGANGTAATGELPSLSNLTTYYVVSTAYDLQTSNASFSSPSVTQTGGATIQYSGSSDGSNFSSWTSDITALSNQNYRYVKFKITLPASSYVSSISVPYNGPSLDSADLSLSAGCGGLERIRSKDGLPGSGHSDPTGLMMVGFWALFYLLAWKFLTASRSRA